MPRKTACATVTEYIGSATRWLINGSDLPAQGKYVFITGCDSGFGRQATEQLVEAGYTVFAGCLTSQACQELDGWSQAHVNGVLARHKAAPTSGGLPKNTPAPPVGSVITVQMDVTKAADVDKAFTIVQAKTKALYAVINNAGISIDTVVDVNSMENFEKVMAVNYMGVVRVTKTFLPLLLQCPDSRLINVSSCAGVLAGPGIAAYCASKHAATAFTHSFRREMDEWGLHVVLIEPGFFKTAIVASAQQTAAKLWASATPDTRARWGEAWFKESNKSINGIVKSAEDPRIVVDTICEAVRVASPSHVYRPGKQSKFVGLPLTYLPTYLLDKLIGLSNVLVRKNPPVGIAARKSGTLSMSMSTSTSTSSSSTAEERKTIVPPPTAAAATGFSLGTDTSTASSADVSAATTAEAATKTHQQQQQQQADANKEGNNKKGWKGGFKSNN